MKTLQYTELYDQDFIDSLPPFASFWNPAVVAVCKWPGEESKYLKGHIEKWFYALPEKEKAHSYTRLRSLVNHEHLSAFWELLIHQYAQEEGWAVEKNPVVEGKTPDFYINTGKLDFFLEVLSIGPGDEERKKQKQVLDVLRTIDGIGTAFPLSLGFREECNESVDLKGVRERVSSWLASLAKSKDIQKMKLNEFGVNLRVSALPYDKKQGDHSIASYSGPGGVIGNGPAQRMKKRMSEKNTRYSFVKDYKKPLVLAMSTDELDWGDSQLERALYGLDVVSFPVNDPTAEAKFYKDNSGFVTPNPGPKAELLMNTRLSAVILCQKRWNNGQMMYDMRVYHNPWATHKISKEVFGKMPQFVETPGKPGFVTMQWENAGKLIYFQ